MAQHRLLLSGLLTASVAAALAVTTNARADLPRPGMTIDTHTAIVITDPQVDFLSEKGVTWGMVGKSVKDNKTVENIGKLLAFADRRNVPIFISPHYYYPHDSNWKFGGALETAMHSIKMFKRENQFSMKGFRDSGADFMPQYRSHINNGRTVVTSPHKVYGPEANDLVLQLRKAGINKVVLAGMSANLCVEAHMRELIEQGFEVVAVSDATAAAILPGLDGYAAAMVNFRMIASDVWSTETAIKKLGETYGKKLGVASPQEKRSKK